MDFHGGYCKKQAKFLLKSPESKTQKCETPVNGGDLTGML